MKSGLVTLAVFVLLFMTVACTSQEKLPVTEESKPSIAPTEQTEQEESSETMYLEKDSSISRAVIFLSPKDEHSHYLDDDGFKQAIERYCDDNNIDYYYMEYPLLSPHEQSMRDYEALIKENTDTEFITVFGECYYDDFIELAEKYSETVFYTTDFRGMVDIRADHYISNDDFELAEYAAKELMKKCDGKESLLFDSWNGANGNVCQIEIFYEDLWLNNKENYDLSEVEIIYVPKGSETEDQNFVWGYYFKEGNIDINVDQVCLYSVWLNNDWYLDQLYKLGLTDEQIFHLDYGIANEANIKKMIDGKSDVFYGYTEEAMHKLLIGTIDRIFAGETVEERLYVEPIILTSKEEAQAYYDEHFA